MHGVFFFGGLLVFIYYNAKDGGIPNSYGWLMTPGIHNVQVDRLLVFIYFNAKDGGIPISYGWLMTPGVHNVQVGRLLVFIWVQDGWSAYCSCGS